MKFIPYSRQKISHQDIRSVIKVLKSDFITQGPKIEEFEKAFCSYLGVKFAVAFNSGTAALHGAYFAAGLTKEDEFITTPITFAATSNAGLYLEAKPIFVDIEKNTGNIDPKKIEIKVNKRTKLIATVHYSGHPVDLEKIKKIARKYKLIVVEDACHALGAKYNWERIGNCQYCDMAVFSFHPVKHITTGEGGMVTTNNPEFYEKLIMFRTHGITKQHLINSSDGQWYYEMQHLGFNYRITDIQAALGISQLKRIDTFVKRRREIVAVYRSVFEKNPYFDITEEKDYAYSAYHLCPILLTDKYKNRKEVIFSKLRRHGLGVQVHYIPVYLHPFYKELGYKKGLCPVAEDFYQREISIPVYPSMTKGDINYVIKTIEKVFKDLKDG